MKVLFVPLRGFDFLGFIPWPLMNGLRELGVFSFIAPQNQAIKDFSNFDLIILCFGHCVETNDSLEPIKETIFNASKEKNVVIIEEDEYGYNYQYDIKYIKNNDTLFNEKNIFYKFYLKNYKEILINIQDKPYFKREMSSLIDYNKNIYPFPMCAFIPDLKKYVKPYKNRPYDLNACFTNTNPSRAKILDKIELNFNNLNNVLSYNWSGFNWGLHKRHFIEYWQSLSQSKIGLVPLGNGMQTIRDFETISYTLTFMEKKNCIVDNFFVHERDCIIFEDLDEITEKIKYYLKNENKSEEIYHNGLKHMLKYHLPKNRAEFFLKICKQNFNLEI